MEKFKYSLAGWSCFQKLPLQFTLRIQILGKIIHSFDCQKEGIEKPQVILKKPTAGRLINAEIS
jgi:hypothetical protein